jgi:hypothetical protein
LTGIEDEFRAPQQAFGAETLDQQASRAALSTLKKATSTTRPSSIPSPPVTDRVVGEKASAGIAKADAKGVSAQSLNETTTVTACIPVTESWYQRAYSVLWTAVYGTRAVAPPCKLTTKVIQGYPFGNTPCKKATAKPTETCFCYEERYGMFSFNRISIISICVIHIHSIE